MTYKVTRCCITQRMTLWANDIQSSLYREKYTKSQRLSPRFSSGAKIFGHVSHSTEHVCVWLVNTLTSTAPIGSPIICIMISSWYCEQWERNLLFGSADVCGAGTRDEPLRTSVWEAICYLTLKENSFQFCGSNVLKTHGTAMGTKMAVAFANIFMARIENQILRQSCIEPYPGHQRIFSHVWWDTSVLAAGQQIFG